VSEHEAVISNWITEHCLKDHPDTSITAQTPLLEQGLLDSIQIVQLINFMETQYQITVDVEDLVPDNFNNVDSICRLVQTRQA